MANETNTDQSFTGDEAEVRLGTLSDLDLLDCSVCCGALTIPIFQCDNGHIACSSCCTNVSNKCPTCTLPIGNYRCRIMERVVEAIIVTRPNAGHGLSFDIGYSEVITTEERLGTLSKLELLDCPVCCHALTIPTFQCDNGHIACSSCCTKLRYKCPTCAFPIGNYRCRIIERVVEATVVPCPNAKHGCMEKFSYGKELVHEKKCGYALCYCPVPNCNYTGVYKDLYIHYNANHKDISAQFGCGGRATGACLRISEKMVVLRQSPIGPLVVVQVFRGPQGLYVSVNCIAPCAPGVGRFSYRICYCWGGKTISFESNEMNRIQKVSFETPEKEFMVVPYCLLNLLQPDALKMCISIRRLEEEKEAEENE